MAQPNKALALFSILSREGRLSRDACMSKLGTTSDLYFLNILYNLRKTQKVDTLIDRKGNVSYKLDDTVPYTFEGVE